MSFSSGSWGILERVDQGHSLSHDFLRSAIDSDFPVNAYAGHPESSRRLGTASRSTSADAIPTSPSGKTLRRLLS